MKKLTIMTVFILAGCQQVETPAAPINVINVPASDAADSLDFTKLPAGFPILAEMELSKAPQNCGLSKANPVSEATRYVFTYQGMDEVSREPLYQVGINGVVRTVKQTGVADRKTRKVRYYKTIDAPEVEIMVGIKLEDDIYTGILGRIKAWDEDTPLMCGYNRIEVLGDCEL